MNDITQYMIIKYINNLLLKHISKVNHYQIYESSLQMYINSISSVYQVYIKCISIVYQVYINCISSVYQ